MSATRRMRSLTPVFRCRKITVSTLDDVRPLAYCARRSIVAQARDDHHAGRGSIPEPTTFPGALRRHCRFRENALLRSLYRQAFIVLALVYASAANAAPYPDVAQLRAAISAAEPLVKAEGLALRMDDARLAGVKLPLLAAGLNLTTGVCQIYYNPTPEAALQPLFDNIRDQHLPVWLAAMAVHEVTHCIEQREVYVRKQFDKVLPPDIKRDGMTLQGYLGVVRSGAVETWGEALADLASVLYVQQTAPELWLDFARDIRAMRQRLAAKWPSHDTSVWLDNLLARPNALPLAHSCFETAFQLRRTYRPQ